MQNDEIHLIPTWMRSLEGNAHDLLISYILPLLRCPLFLKTSTSSGASYLVDKPITNSRNLLYYTTHLFVRLSERWEDQKERTSIIDMFQDMSESDRWDLGAGFGIWYLSSEEEVNGERDETRIRLIVPTSFTIIHHPASSSNEILVAEGTDILLEHLSGHHLTPTREQVISDSIAFYKTSPTAGETSPLMGTEQTISHLENDRRVSVESIGHEATISYPPSTPFFDLDAGEPPSLVDEEELADAFANLSHSSPFAASTPSKSDKAVQPLSHPIVSPASISSPAQQLASSSSSESPPANFVFKKAQRCIRCRSRGVKYCTVPAIRSRKACYGCYTSSRKCELPSQARLEIASWANLLPWKHDPPISRSLRKGKDVEESTDEEVGGEGQEGDEVEEVSGIEGTRTTEIQGGDMARDEEGETVEDVSLEDAIVRLKDVIVRWDQQLASRIENEKRLQAVGPEAVGKDELEGTTRVFKSAVHDLKLFHMLNPEI